MNVACGVHAFSVMGNEALACGTCAEHGCIDCTCGTPGGGDCGDGSDT